MFYFLSFFLSVLPFFLSVLLPPRYDNDFHDKATDSLINYEAVKYFANEDFERRRYGGTKSHYTRVPFSADATRDSHLHGEAKSFHTET
jgi:ABC-type transport system involved in Fe-S cluster assembly fused permease/ATPase subunit